MNQFLTTVPFELYDLHIFNLVAKNGGFASSAKMAGLSQSAITRIIQRMELKLGTKLLNRTTRRVELTPAGHLLHLQSQRILAEVSHTLDLIQQSPASIPKTLNIGVSRSIGLAYLPGFFAAFQKIHPEVLLNVVQESSSRLTELLVDRSLELGIICQGPLPREIQIQHSFEDSYALVCHRDLPLPFAHAATLDLANLAKLALGNRWLLPGRISRTGKQLHLFLKRHELPITPSFESENLDLLINMVSLGHGLAIVPARSAALYLPHKPILKLPLKPAPSRTLLLISRKDQSSNALLQAFASSFLF